MTQQTAVMICGHGSRDTAAVSEFNTLAGHLRQRFPDRDVESGFLEFASPVIREGLDKLAERGAERIVCLPGMLFAAGHVKNDVPSEVNDFARAHPAIEVVMARDLAIEPRLLKAASERIEAAEAAAATDVPREETLLMVVGRGTNDPDANSNVAKVARMLWEGLGFGWAEVSYSGVAYPLVDAGLAQAAKLGFRRVIVFPYFLFTGILVRRIYDWVDQAAAAHPDIEFLKASYLNDHPLLIDVFVDRVGEALAGDGANAMNCQMCKYREQIIGHEDAVGTPQAGHHHHVRGIGTDDGHGHHHDHHGHHHHHHHGPGHTHGEGKDG